MSDLKFNVNTLDEKYRFSKTETLLKLYGNLELKFPVWFQQCGNYCIVSAGFRQVSVSGNLMCKFQSSFSSAETN